MDSESSCKIEENTSPLLQSENEHSAHSTQDFSEKTSSGLRQNMKEDDDDDDDDAVSETCHSTSSEKVSNCENSLVNNDSIINGKDVNEQDEPSDSKEAISNNESSSTVEQADAAKVSLDDKVESSEETLSTDDHQSEQMSNGLNCSSDLADDKNKCAVESNDLESHKTKSKDSVMETVCETAKSENDVVQARSFSIITRSKQSAKKGISNTNNHDKTEKSFVLSEVTDDDIEQIKDDSCFPDYLTDLLSVGRYIPVKIVNPSDYRPKNNETLIEAPSLTVPLLVKERNIYFDKTYKPERRKNTTQDNYFNSSVGQLLIGLGFSRVREWYHRDMAKVKERQMRRSGKSAALEKELQEHKNEHLQAKQANEPFTSPMKKCQMCPFQTESNIILEGHYLTPHISPRREYLCNFCNFNSRDPKLILFHMEAIHSKRGIIDLPVFYECPFCSFESHLKTKFSSHLTRCQRTFRSALNQSAPRDFPYPTLTPKPVTTSDIKEYENSFANIGNSMPYSTKSSQKYLMTHTSGSGRPLINMPALYQQLASVEYQQLHHLPANNVQLLPGSGVIRTKYPVMNQVHCGQNKVPFPITSNHIYHFVNSNGQLVPVMGKDLVNPATRLPFLQNSMESNSQQRKSFHSGSDSGNIARIIKLDSKKSIITTQPSESKSSSVSHAPRAHITQNVQSPKSALPKVSVTGQSSKIVICEICDGYIKDLEQLQTHMHWIHKVKIHPKMLASRPPLNCQKCQSRFFTDQGLERHLLGTHGLVTPNMQDMANKNQDGGCCTICRQFYACKLVAHISQVHKITLKPAHLSYKCTVCSATFSLYRQFENHVYSVHSGSGKRSADSDPTQSSKKAALSVSGKKTNSTLVDKQGKILEKNTSLSSHKGEHGDLASNHAGTNSLIYIKDKQGKHSLQPLTRLKRRKYLRSSDGQ